MFQTFNHTTVIRVCLVIAELQAPSSGKSTRRRTKRRDLDEVPLMNGAEFDVGTRRSTRQRKLIYSTFNQKLIDQHLDIITETTVASSADDEVEATPRPRRKRRRVDAEPAHKEVWSAIHIYPRHKLLVVSDLSKTHSMSKRDNNNKKLFKGKKCAKM